MKIQPFQEFFNYCVGQWRSERTYVVSVDSITLINPTLRMRRILNYQRPPEERPLDQVRLAGFGVEQKM